MTKLLAPLALIAAVSACSQVAEKSEPAVSRPEKKVTQVVNEPQPAQSQAKEEIIQVSGIRQEQAKAILASSQIGIQQDAVGVMAPAYRMPPAGTEKYQHIASHDVVRVDEKPVSTFSADVDTASYANLRRMLSQGHLPPQDAVRVEELINYFSYDYPKPHSLQQPIRVDTQLTDSPWNPNNQLLRIGVNTYQSDPAQRADANLVFLIDVSGSMRSANKLPLVQQSLNLLLTQLRPTDMISLVTYAGATQVVLPATPVSEMVQIKQAIENLTASGSTYGEAGIELAYQQAAKGFINQGINQIYLMSDGDLNVGLTDIEQLKQKIAQKRKEGVQFSTFGFGQGNYNDHLMEQLADHGNGMASYIDNLHEAQKLLVDQLGSSLQTVAHDVKFQMEFNPAQVSEYRLIGYENRQLARADFNNDRKDAGELGAGHQVTVLYEITPVGAQGLTDPLVFQRTKDSSSGQRSFAEIRVRYKKAQGEASHKLTLRVEPSQKISLNGLNSDDSFAIAVAAWGQKLKASSYLNDLTYEKIIHWANQSKGNDPFGYRAEFVRLVRLSASLSQERTKH